MKSLLTLVLIVMVQSAAEIDKDKERLQGTWVQIGGSYGGADFASGSYKGHVLPKSKMIIAGDSWTVEIKTPYKQSPEITKGSFAIFPSVMPMGIELKSENQIAQGIYRLSDNILTICLSSTGKAERPKDFSRCVPDGYALLTYKRT